VFMVSLRAFVVIAQMSEAKAAENRAAINLALQQLESFFLLERRLWPAERGK